MGETQTSEELQGVLKPRKPWLFNCPRCKRRQHFRCSNRSCSCNKKLPKGQKYQIWIDGEALKCPYCGFTRHADYWEDHSLRAVYGY